MGTLLNRRRYMGGKSLPYDAEIEYLESTGTQWIDTDYILTTPYSMRVILDFAVSKNSNQKNIFGSNDNNGLNAYFQTGTSFGIYMSRGYVLQNVPISLNNRAVLDLYIPSGANAGTLIYNGITYTTSAKDHTQGNTHFYLYTQSPPSTRTSKLQIYSCKIYDNEVLVRDFIPVRKGTAGYLYDKVSGTLFGNAGTGDFVLGSDKT